MSVFKRVKAPLLAGATILSLAACSQRESSVPRADRAPEGQRAEHREAQFVLTATIKELMDSTVDPAADVLWDSVAINATKVGIEEKKPRTAEEWLMVQRSAMTLIESMNLVVMEGRHAAPPGTQPALGELPPIKIDQRIAATRPTFIELARNLGTTAKRALDAIDRKDSEALFAVGGDIDAACEACHLTYWYPEAEH
jgi:hypothetical protein